MSYYYDSVEVGDLVGKVFDQVERGNQELLFKKDGLVCYKLYHDQDCCESVCLESVAGDLEWLEGTPILEAYESVSRQRPADVVVPEYSESVESETWTFYRLSTIKGTVVLRWYGESNGYYSESVSLGRVEPYPAQTLPTESLPQYKNAVANIERAISQLKAEIYTELNKLK